MSRRALGSTDFQAYLDIEGEDDALLYVRSQLVLASRLAGIDVPVDTPVLLRACGVLALAGDAN